MMQTMMTDSRVSATHSIAAIVTLVDTMHGERTLLEHHEARQQVALADRILISKTDLRPISDSLLRQLEVLNPGAPHMPTSQADPPLLFSSTSVKALSERIDDASRQVGHGEIETFTITRDRPLPALALTMLLQAMAEHCGSQLLRFKGLVVLEEMPGQPAVIHGVRHVVSPPTFLDRWPSDDERTRIVFIGKEVPRYFISRLLDAIEEEVRETLTTPLSTSDG